MSNHMMRLASRKDDERAAEGGDRVRAEGNGMSGVSDRLSSRGAIHPECMRSDGSGVDILRALQGVRPSG
jgi:hypothetical protein